VIKSQFELGKFMASIDRAMSRQVPFAVAKTLTQLAQGAKKVTEEEMARKFDRPTPWTMKSLFYVPANKNDNPIMSRVWLMDGMGRQGGRAGQNKLAVIGHQFLGGDRPRKQLEYWLQRAGLIGTNEYIAPGERARLDQYGNISRGQVQQIMSQLKLGVDPYSWSSNSKRSRRNVAKAGEMFFSRGPGQWSGRRSWKNGHPQHLPKGVWMRIKFGHGQAVVPILMVIKKPRYTQRIDMIGIGRAYHKANFEPLFKMNLYEAMRTAR
jgi:hypothetical protein